MTNFFRLATLAGLLALAHGARAQAPTFAPTVNYSSGGTVPSRIVAVDVNGDGKKDMLTGNWFTGTVGVLLNTGNGTFAPAVTYAAGSGAATYGFAVADVNSDGKPDVLVTNDPSSTGNNIGVLLGNGDGTFQAAAFYSTTTAPYSMVAADVNHDGKLDIITSSNTFTNTVGVLLGNGNGAFQATTTYYAGGSSNLSNIYTSKIAAVDINGDNNLDLVTTTSDSPTVGVLMGNGNGTFQAVVFYASGGSNPGDMAMADVNGDSKPDLLIADLASRAIYVSLGNGNGTFQSPVAYVMSGDVGQLEVADVNGDGKLDLLTPSSTSITSSTPMLSILLGNGNGSFQPPTFYNIGNSPSVITAVDVNGDGKLDLLTANYFGRVSYNFANNISVLLNATPLATRTALPGATATLSPNPATTAATLSLAGLPAAVAQVQATLLDATGCAVARHTLAAAQGSARTELPTAALAAGLYVLRLEALDAQGQLAGSLPAQRLSIR